MPPHRYGTLSRPAINIPTAVSTSRFPFRLLSSDESRENGKVLLIIVLCRMEEESIRRQWHKEITFIDIEAIKYSFLLFCSLMNERMESYIRLYFPFDSSLDSMNHEKMEMVLLIIVLCRMEWKKDHRWIGMEITFIETIKYSFLVFCPLNERMESYVCLLT